MLNVERANPTGAFVMERSIAAFRTLHRLPEKGKPLGFKSSAVFANVISEVSELDDSTKTIIKIRIIPSAIEISQMEEVLDWISLFLNEWPEIRKAFLVYVSMKALNKPVKWGLVRSGMTRPEFEKNRLSGSLIIATGLMKGGGGKAI